MGEEGSARPGLYFGDQDQEILSLNTQTETGTRFFCKNIKIKTKDVDAMNIDKYFDIFFMVKLGQGYS